MSIQQVWVRRDNLRERRVVSQPQAELAGGAIRVRIEKFGLTANNVSYAITGDSIGYWRYFPAEGEWGIVPVWGFGDVVESRCPEVPVGDRLWGFFPMATAVDLTPAKVGPDSFHDAAPHRADLPRMYNRYHRTGNDPQIMQEMEDERCLLFPLFATSFIVADYLKDNGFFGADQVLIGSASSKTGFGLASMLHMDGQVSQRIIGLTSARNRNFVEGLGVCDQVVSYDDIEQLPTGRRTAFVDMSGDAALVRRIHRHLADDVVESCIVGATHWEADREWGELPGARPAFFFAPTRFAKREKEWGRGQVLLRAFMASVPVAKAVAERIDVQYLHGAEAVAERFLALLDNEVPASIGLMLSMHPPGQTLD